MRLSTIERKILNSIQEDIPFESQPFKILAKRAGVKEKIFIQRVKSLKKKGTIRTFAAGLNHKRLGFVSTLVGLRVPLSRINTIAEDITRYPEVTHCYLREGEYNLWAVFISLKKERLRVFLKRLTKEVGRENILNLKTRRQFKLNTRLKL